jgi:hypothetical protein
VKKGCGNFEKHEKHKIQQAFSVNEAEYASRHTGNGMYYELKAVLLYLNYAQDEVSDEIPCRQAGVKDGIIIVDVEFGPSKRLEQMFHVQVVRFFSEEH